MRWEAAGEGRPYRDHVLNSLPPPFAGTEHDKDGKGNDDGCGDRQQDHNLKLGGVGRRRVRARPGSTARHTRHRHAHPRDEETPLHDVYARRPSLRLGTTFSEILFPAFNAYSMAAKVWTPWAIPDS